MYRRIVRPARSVLLVLVVASALAVAPQLTRPSIAHADVSATVCGVLGGFVPATNLTSGQIIIGNAGYIIVPRAVVTGNAGVVVGGNVCLTATFNAAGQITSGALSAPVTSSVSVCGVVTGFASPTGFSAGYVTINGQTYTIAPNNNLGLTSITLGAVYCLNSSVNSLGQLVGGTLVPQSVTQTNICGVLGGFAPPTIFSPGYIIIGGQTYLIAPGVVFTTSLPVGGSVVCLAATFNAANQIVGGSLTVNTTTQVQVCGAFGGLVAATLSTPGTIVISGQVIPIAAGATIVGAATPALNATICLSGTENAAGQLISGSLAVTTLGSLSLCGVVSAYTPATSSAAGSITIGGQTYGIAPGVTLGGASLAAVGNPTLCILISSVNGAGQIVAATLSGGGTSAGTPSVYVCGMVTAYTAATATTGGSITVAGRTLVINAGAVFTGSAQPAVGTAVCLTLAVDSNGNIVGGTVVATATGVPLSATLPQHARPVALTLAT